MRKIYKALNSLHTRTWIDQLSYPKWHQKYNVNISHSYVKGMRQVKHITTLFWIAELQTNFRYSKRFMSGIYILCWPQTLEDLKKMLKQDSSWYFWKKTLWKAFSEKISLFLILERPASLAKIGLARPASGRPLWNLKVDFFVVS